MMVDKFLIWSIEHNAWWRMGGIGYTQELWEAGVYPAARAREIVARANIVKVNECLIPVASGNSVPPRASAVPPPPATEDESRTDRLARLFVHLIGHGSDGYRGFAVVKVGAFEPSITCVACGFTSFNANDVAQKYCGHCHVFHESP